MKAFSVVCFVSTKDTGKVFFTVKWNPCKLITVIIQKTRGKTHATTRRYICQRRIMIRTVKVMGFESNDEYNEIMFLREITHTVNAFNDMADIVRLYSKKPEMAEQRLENLLSEVLYEDSDSV